ncbi:MAG: virulence RhuM family protein [Spirochaetaceae bacterium]|jgi:hypothetical protein|nr:virulence RhuM family protein [Spirochaetaceae bacterium]
MQKKQREITIRSSAAEYLTFVAATGDNPQSVEMRYEDENIWLTQKMMATLYDVEVNTINYNIKKVFEDSELQPEATIRKFRIVQTEGQRQVEREVDHYSLQMIIAIGFKVNSQRAVQFRKWVNQIAKDYTIKGWVMDSERFKQGGSILNDQYFDELLWEIREIRMSERKFYQKVTDIYTTSIDYDPTAKTTKDFFTKVQNKLHWAIVGQTAAEIIYTRADADKKHMGLTTWKHSPHGKIIKTDVSVAKNYLSKTELEGMGLIVSAYLDLAESRARRKMPTTMEDWAKQLDLILQASEYDILDNPGKISAEIAKLHAETEFEKYRIVQDKLFQSDFDKLVALEMAINREKAEQGKPKKNV